jgi:hypothetical protein
MSFTDGQIEALDALEAAFGPTETDAGRVRATSAVAYEGDAKRYLTYALEYYGHWKLATDPEFAEKQRLALEEEARKRSLSQAARAGEVRESAVLGMLTGLMPKAKRTFPAGRVDLKVTAEHFGLYMESVDGQTYVTLNFDRKSFVLTTGVQGEVFSENLTHLNGNSRPREQSDGLDAVHEYLDGLAV